MWVGTTEDNTHLQMNGAIKVSELVARLVKELNIPLSDFVTLEGETPEQEAPHTKATVEGELQNGWYTSPAQVTFTASDEDSEIEGTYYQINGGETVSGTQLTLTEEGTHTITYWSVDVDGNKESEQSLSISIDLVPPTIEIHGQTEYTIDQHVEIGYTASDMVSGVAEPEGVLLDTPAYALEPGLNQVTATVSDLAGWEQTVEYNFGVIATFDSLINLTNAFADESTDPTAGALADQLTNTLKQAKQAANDREGAKARQLLASYGNDVQAARGTVLPDEQASVLIKWEEWLHQTTPLANGALALRCYLIIMVTTQGSRTETIQSR